jgi:hypothetical protein
MARVLVVVSREPDASGELNRPAGVALRFLGEGQPPLPEILGTGAGRQWPPVRSAAVLRAARPVGSVASLST